MNFCHATTNRKKILKGIENFRDAPNVDEKVSIKLALLEKNFCRSAYKVGQV